MLHFDLKQAKCSITRAAFDLPMVLQPVMWVLCWQHTFDADVLRRPFRLKLLPEAALEGLLLAKGFAGSSMSWPPASMSSTADRGDPGPAVASATAAAVSAYAFFPEARARISAGPHRAHSTAALSHG